MFKKKTIATTLYTLLHRLHYHYYGVQLRHTKKSTNTTNEISLIFLGLRERSHDLKFLQYENEIVQFYLTNKRKRDRENERTSETIKNTGKKKNEKYYLHVERERKRERERDYESKNERMRKRKRYASEKIIIFNLHETTLVHRIKERAIDYLCVIYTYIQYIYIYIYIYYIYIYR